MSTLEIAPLSRDTRTLTGPSVPTVTKLTLGFVPGYQWHRLERLNLYDVGRSPRRTVGGELDRVEIRLVRVHARTGIDLDRRGSSRGRDECGQGDRRHEQNQVTAREIHRGPPCNGTKSRANRIAEKKKSP